MFNYYSVQCIQCQSVTDSAQFVP